MREFFRGWRRKFGVMTLVMACLFGLEWLRGQSTVDLIQFTTGNRTWQEWAFSDGIIRYWAIKAEDVPKETIPNVIRWKSYDLFWGMFDKHGDQQLLRWLENRHKPYEGPIRDWKIPCSLFIRFWTIIIPLLLLSVFLLFSKPPPHKPQTPPEPTPVTDG
jgi:hypothetical protein